MALAKKCDRCGKLYEHYPNGKKSIGNAIKRVRKSENGTIIFEEVSIDLCPECMDSFNAFILRGKCGDEH